MLLLPICAGGSRLKYLHVSGVLGCVSGMFNMFNMSGMVMDWIGAGVAPVARPPHCVPVFWAVQCLVSGQGRTCASFSGGGAANGCLITVPFLPISSLSWPYDLGFWWPGNKRAADRPAPQELRLCVWRMLAAGGIESYTDTHQLTESRMITWQNDALLMCHLLLFTLLKYLYILLSPPLGHSIDWNLHSPILDTLVHSPDHGCYPPP